jgi:hypothetical protein
VQLALWTSGLDADIINGTYDGQIQELIKGFKLVGRPVWIRIGYEFNGPWNHHDDPQLFAAAWVHITKMLRADAWCNKNVATVFDYTADAPGEKAGMDWSWSYYPGDEWVDWGAANPFNPLNQGNLEFIANASARGLPVMLGESTPAQHAGSWDWYEQWFGLVTKYPNIRAACYINWDWFPGNWGDARIEHTPAVGQKYQAEMKNPKYKWFHASDKASVLKRLGL